MMTDNRIEKLFCDEKFVKKLFNAKTGVEIKNLFKENGFEINDSQLEDIKNEGKKLFSTIKDMDSEELEKISAGFSTEEKEIIKESATYTGVVGAAVGTVCGFIRGVSKSLKNAKKNRSYFPSKTDDDDNVICEAASILCRTIADGAIGAMGGALLGAGTYSLGKTIISGG